jgi:hypothetical protein
VPVRDGQRELNLERVHAGDVMHDHTDRASVVWNASLPLGVRERGREGSEGRNSLFETIGQRVGELAADTRTRVRLERSVSCHAPNVATGPGTGFTGSGHSSGELENGLSGPLERSASSGVAEGLNGVDTSGPSGGDERRNPA